MHFHHSPFRPLLFLSLYLYLFLSHFYCCLWLCARRFGICIVYQNRFTVTTLLRIFFSRSFHLFVRVGAIVVVVVVGVVIGKKRYVTAHTHTHRLLQILRHNQSRSTAHRSVLTVE